MRVRTLVKMIFFSLSEHPFADVFFCGSILDGIHNCGKCSRTDQRTTCYSETDHFVFPPLFLSVICLSDLREKIYSQVSKTEAKASCYCSCYYCCDHCFFLLICFVVCFCFPCCDYIIPCKSAFFNEQIVSAMLVKQQKCDVVLHKQHSMKNCCRK